MSRTKGSTPDIINLRQRKVQLLLAEGKSRVEIGRLLGVSDETIRRDQKELKAHGIARAGGIELSLEPISTTVVAGDIWRQHVRELIRIRRRRWELRARMKEEKDSSQLVLALAREERAEGQWEAQRTKETVELLQTLGAMYRAPVAVTFTHRLSQVLDGLTPQQLAELDGMGDRQYQEWLRQHKLLPDERRLLGSGDGTGGEPTS